MFTYLTTNSEGYFNHYLTALYHDILFILTTCLYQFSHLFCTHQPITLLSSRFLTHLFCVSVSYSTISEQRFLYHTKYTSEATFIYSVYNYFISIALNLLKREQNKTYKIVISAFLFRVLFNPLNIFLHLFSEY